MNKFALVLSGGAGRGAYEVGVLKYIFQELPKIYKKLPKFNIICGTSVGAIHACFLAAHLFDITNQINNLENIWNNLSPSKVIDYNLNQIFKIKELILGGDVGAGLFDINPLINLIKKECNWNNISNSINQNYFDTLCVSTTSTTTGKTVVFTETNQKLPNPIFRTEFRSTKISIEHALASASIPIIFPPIQINGEWFTDGGVRQNTPIVPALGFEATHVLSIGLWHERKQTISLNDGSPGIGCLLGKIFNSFFIDHADVDVHNLEHINNIIKAGIDLYGDSFANHLANQNRPYKFINSFAISPSLDIGKVAAKYLTNLTYKDKLYKNILKLINKNNIEADLASYLMFDGNFSKILINLGFEDAKLRSNELASFLGLFDI